MSGRLAWARWGRCVCVYCCSDCALGWEVEKLNQLVWFLLVFGFGLPAYYSWFKYISTDVVLDVHFFYRNRKTDMCSTQTCMSRFTTWCKYMAGISEHLFEVKENLKEREKLLWSRVQISMQSSQQKLFYLLPLWSANIYAAHER